MTDTFPRQQARTRNFSLGAPRSFQISADGSRLAFLRSKGGSDPVTCLWVLDLPADPQRPDGGSERLVVDPIAIGAGKDEPEEERARRERSREQAGGVVAFATDAGFTMAAFAIAGQVYTAQLTPDGHGPRQAGAQSPAIDPRPDPAGRRVAYVCNGALRITDLASGTDTELIGPHGEHRPGDVTFGLAEFVAAEEMGRMRGYWWAPDGSALLVARVDNSAVHRWFIADPANPDRPPAEVGYPAAGTPNALVELMIVNVDGSSVPVRWDADAFGYLTTASWDAGAPLIVVQSRGQRRMRLLSVDPETGATSVLRDDSDACWLDIVPGVPGRLADGRIVWTADADGARRLLVASERQLSDGTAEPVTPPGLQVRAVLSVDGDTVLMSGSDGESMETGVWAYGQDGLRRVSGDCTVRPDGTVRRDGTQAALHGHGAAEHRGVHGAIRAGGTTVLTSRSMAGHGLTVTVLRDQPAGPAVAATIGSLAEQPAFGGLRVELLRAGRREIRTALLLPSWHKPGSAKLPVLMDPYGGPHAQRVLASADAYLTSQWFADQGFAVVVADGRGTPGRGPQWDRAVAGDLADPVLDDQVEALAAAAEFSASQHGSDLDLSRVAIRGWSFGGYLSALAVLRRPDVFHAAIAGAPVTDWRLYDTHYTERYLGHPGHNPAAYDRSSLLADAHKLSRPLMIIHGMADDNVVVAHTMRLSSALLAAGRPHQVLPLSGVTHMASQEEVAENLLLLQVDFLRRALDIGASVPGRPAPCR
ncbi:MAG TPA: prolyl oligopeptidase family serine peptidase [Streptosporangiaceae bacterium]|nr:prolyl oligopeptidase family serine peptidase [Streptosporangiaceae bacterium]